jgi:hypothetical protein
MPSKRSSTRLNVVSVQMIRESKELEANAFFIQTGRVPRSIVSFLYSRGKCWSSAKVVKSWMGKEEISDDSSW